VQIGFYEDRAATDLGPIAQMRPVFELVCGRFTLRERVNRLCRVSAWGGFLRDSLAETYQEERPEARVNDFRWLGEAATLLVNGRWLPRNAVLSNLRDDEVGMIGDTIVSLTLDPLEAPQLQNEAWDDALQRIARSRRPVQAEGKLIRYPWDLVEHNAEQLIADFHLCEAPRRKSTSDRNVRLRAATCDFGPQRAASGHNVAVLGPASDVAVDPSATIDPFVVLDARKGPVSIDAEAVIGSFTQLQGPCHVGQATQLFRAHVREATTIGPVCRVGGEIEASILHGCVNKYHDGFLGHSYVCPWVNLGALTSNSDLKSDYSSVTVPLSGGLIDTGRTKVGCFIGDHSKTALDSMFNTGSSIGVMCIVLPAGELLPKHIPSFSRVWHGELIDGWDFERSLESAALAMGRRGRQLTPAGQRLLRFLFEQTRPEREEAIERFREKTASRQRALVSAIASTHVG